MQLLPLFGSIICETCDFVNSNQHMLLNDLPMMFNGYTAVLGTLLHSNDLNTFFPAFMNVFLFYNTSVKTEPSTCTVFSGKPLTLQSKPQVPEHCLCSVPLGGPVRLTLQFSVQ